MYGSTLIFAAAGLAAVGRWCYPWLKLRDLSTAWRERPQRNAFFFLRAITLAFGSHVVMAFLFLA
jgi:hypothetical protein